MEKDKIIQEPDDIMQRIDAMGKRNMTRAERRRFEKEVSKPAPVYQYTEKQLKQFIIDGVTTRLRNITDKIIEETIENSLTVTTLVLKDEFGIGRKRMAKFIDAYNTMFTAIADEELDLDYIKERAASMTALPRETVPEEDKNV